MDKELANIYKGYLAELMEFSRNGKVRLALTRAIASYRENLSKTLEKYPHTVKLADEVRKIKERSIRRWKRLLREAMENLEDNGAEAYFAETSEEARKIAGEIVGSKKIVVKSKSLTAEEISLREYLEDLGNEVWETDIGELIIQLSRSKPSHLTSPAIHVPREEVARLLSNVLGVRVAPEIAEEVKVARAFLRRKFIDAHVGISGSNAVAADTGSLFIIENEGNVRLSTGLPPIHLAIVGIEKVVPNMIDAFKVVEVTWRYAQYTVPSYLNIISGPSKTGDIEKIVTYGVHGPKELHVIFLDNGRSTMARDPVFKEALYCLRCGGCMYECPVFALAAGSFGYKYFIGYGAIWTAFVAGGMKRAAPIVYTCLRCDRCAERCPVKIDTSRMVLKLRAELLSPSRHAS
jgi:L-lactate dehydrogenase complex protein LldG